MRMSRKGSRAVELLTQPPSALFSTRLPPCSFLVGFPLGAAQGAQTKARGAYSKTLVLRSSDKVQESWPSPEDVNSPQGPLPNLTIF